jgi:D-alanyl-lipoteichoic acid acyltransferase DltB (MBOAT superfamily)
MTFTTITFFIFFLLFFVVYWLLARGNKNLRNAFMILGGYVFYGWWDWRFLILLIFSSTIDFSSGLLIHGAKKPGSRKLFLALSLTVNICLLGFFKYCDFFITSLGELMHSLGYTGSLTTLHIILPVGLSFYTFQSMSYALDVYKNKLQPTRNLVDFFAFVSFFPQLVAGPIERAVHMLPQFAAPKKFDYSQAVAGMRMILWGLFKKMVIADTLAVFVNAFFAGPLSFDSLSAWIALLAFAFQIYCDFSGYSDMAIGFAKLLGFELMINFRTPYFARSFTEFWQRWHISLSTWFRDYVFIPLGGNKKGMGKYLVNIFITFFLSGLWHGANYTFAIWGVMHALLLMQEKLWQRFFPAFKSAPPVVFMAVILCWVPFRAKNLIEMTEAYEVLFNFHFHFHHFIAAFNVHNLSFGAIFIVFILGEAWLNKTTFAEKIKHIGRPWRWLVYYTLIACIFLFGDFNNAPSFIYFQF